LPGKPDIVLPKYKAVIFVHGCFWHGHEGCRKSQLPTSNIEFWTEKIDKNKERDQQKIRELEKLGWKVIVIWQCEIKNVSLQKERLDRLLLEIR
jgi:DNA mismatch endonuclease (patch repair protein)